MKSFLGYLTEAPSYEKVRDTVVSVTQMILRTSAAGDVSWTIEEIPIKRIVTRERGKRYPLDKLIAAYKSNPESVVPIGLFSPRSGDKKYLVLDGHHRLKSAKLAGLEKIWAVVMQYKTDNLERDQKCRCGHTKHFHNGSTMFGWADCIECTSCKKFVRAKSEYVK